MRQLQNLIMQIIMNNPSIILPGEECRKDYPILNREIHGRKLVYFDNAASTQTPRQVVDTVRDMYFTHKANVHRGVHTLSMEATGLQEEARKRLADFIGAKHTEEIIFTRGTTEAINLVSSSYGQLLKEGDEIILTVMEHHANIVPWQLLQDRRGIVIKAVPITKCGELDMDAYRIKRVGNHQPG